MEAPIATKKMTEEEEHVAGEDFDDDNGDDKVDKDEE